MQAPVPPNTLRNADGTLVWQQAMMRESSLPGQRICKRQSQGDSAIQGYTPLECACGVCREYL